MKINTYQFLGFAGLLPFVGLLCLFSFPSDYLLINPPQTFIFYSVVILSFISGTLWRKLDTPDNEKPQIISNMFCLFAFICLLIPISAGLYLLIIGYLSIFFTEYVLTQNKQLTEVSDYLKMRLILTITVSLLHCVALFYYIS